MSTSWGFELAEIELPEFDLPKEKPVVPRETYLRRLEATYGAMQERGLDVLVVYGDREHFANTQFLTGFDPRYEESILVLVPGRTPYLLVGNENLAHARGAIPYPIDVSRLPKLSLVGQPDPGDLTLADALRGAGLDSASLRRAGLVGWKYWGGSGAENWIDVPHFIVTEVAALVDSVENATDLFVAPGYGLRLTNDVDQIAYFEFAAGHGSAAMLRLLRGVRSGMTELEVSQLMQPVLLPFNYHPTMLSGVNTAMGVASPGGKVLEVGEPVAAGIGYWGSNTARAGFLVEEAGQLPPDAQDVIEKLVAPYYATAAAWYETIRIGLTAGELYDVTYSRIGDPFYGVYLNPGHYIHLDEWPSSPVVKDSPVVFASGNAIQLDIIPSTGTAYGTFQIEDGIVLADAELRASLRASYPDAWRRIQQRRDMLQEVFGITLHDEVLPMSNTAGYLPPFWLAPQLAMVRS